MVFTGVKLFPKAAELFLLAVTAPAQALNAIVAQSYKKYVLVSLISRGAVPPLPKYTPAVVQRSVKARDTEKRRRKTQRLYALRRHQRSGNTTAAAAALSFGLLRPAPSSFI